MATMMSTKMTKGGQTTVPKEIRARLGIADDARVYWSLDGDRAWLSADPLEVSSTEELMARIELGRAQAREGRVTDSDEVIADIARRYGLGAL